MQQAPISEELLSILVCPESKQALTLASNDIINALNSKIKDRSLKNKSGRVIEEIISSALIREDNKVLYPITDGIPVLLIEEGITLDF